MGKAYHHLTYNDRKVIEEMCGGHTVVEIAGAVGKSPATVCRELRRCGQGNYSAELAQEDVEMKQRKRYEYLSLQNMPPRHQGTRGQAITPTEKKQIETCIRMHPLVDVNTVARITGINRETVDSNFERIKKQVMAM